MFKQIRRVTGQDAARKPSPKDTPESDLTVLARAFCAARPGPAKARARDALILAAMPLVRAIAARFQDIRGNRFDRDDQVSAGTARLIEAVDRFTADRDPASFGNYAALGIRGAVLNVDRRRGGLMSDDQWEMCPRLRRAEQEFYASHGRNPGDDELADVMRLTGERWRRMVASLRSIPKCLSLHRESGPSDRTLMDDVVNAKAARPGEEPDSLADGHATELFNRVTANLTPANRKLLRRHLVEGESVADLARAAGVHESTMRERLWKAKDKVRRGITPDGVPIRDPRPLVEVARELFKGKAERLLIEWHLVNGQGAKSIAKKLNVTSFATFQRLLRIKAAAWAVKVGGLGGRWWDAVKDRVTPEQERLLEMQYVAGASAREIAVATGRHWANVSHRVRRLIVTLCPILYGELAEPTTAVPWRAKAVACSDEELLRLRGQGLGYKAIGKLLGRHQSSVKERLDRLLPSHPNSAAAAVKRGTVQGPAVTDQMITSLASAHGLGVEQIARRLGRHHSSIAERLKRIAAKRAFEESSASSVIAPRAGRAPLGLVVAQAASEGVAHVA